VNNVCSIPIIIITPVDEFTCAGQDLDQGRIQFKGRIFTEKVLNFENGPT
jgi:hypothetical protein